MKILHILNHTRKSNGHVHAVVDLACIQSKMGHKVSVASAGGDFHNILNKNGVHTIQIDQSRNFFTLVHALFRMIGIARDYDILHAHMMTSAVLGWFSSKITRVPLVTTVHNEFERSSILMGLGNRVIAVSRAVERSMIERGIPKYKLKTVLNGTIGSPRFGDTPSEPITLPDLAVLFVGGLHPRKGLPILLKAFAIASQKIDGLTLHIVGDGPNRGEYEALTKSLVCSKSIFYYGGQPDPRPWFEKADIFVLPSIAEPAGLVLSEASDAGCALIGSNVGGIPEMLDGGNAGILVDPGSISELADALIRLSSDHLLLVDAKRRSRLNRKRLTVERVTSETVSVYLDLVKK